MQALILLATLLTAQNAGAPSQKDIDEAVKKGLEWFAQLEDPWWPGYPEEMLDEDALRHYYENQAKRKAAKVSIIADAPVPSKKPTARKRRGTRR